MSHVIKKDKNRKNNDFNNNNREKLFVFLKRQRASAFAEQRKFYEIDQKLFGKYTLYSSLSFCQFTKFMHRKQRDVVWSADIKSVSP